MQRYLITGASRGIGRAIAVRLASQDKTLLVQGRDKSSLDETCNLVKSKEGKAIPIVADLSNIKEVESLISQVGDAPLHLLVNNAGVAFVKPVAEITLPEWQETLAVNVIAPFLIIQRLLPQMTKGTSIVNILSIAARTGFPNWSSCCASKFALEGFSQSIREELRPKGVRVINIYPGAVNTDMWKGVPGDWPKEKMIEPEQVAEAVYYAVSQPNSVMVENIDLGNLAGNL